VNSSLIIFVKNKIPGTVKTRISQDQGDDSAMAVYEELLRITSDNCQAVKAEKKVYYSSFIELNDDWDENLYQKKIQEGSNLGERIHKAFLQELETAGRVVLIGSDCPYLTNDHIESAFKFLGDYDVVLGPCEDGGYYLIGLKINIPELFQDISWSSEKVLDQTIDKIKKLKLSYTELETLSDIDYWNDWEDYLQTMA
jgi:rSAM/selenodomain-associated transferase 1